jgi:hypothetical protein
MKRNKLEATIYEAELRNHLHSLFDSQEVLLDLPQEVLDRTEKWKKEILKTMRMIILQDIL